MLSQFLTATTSNHKCIGEPPSPLTRLMLLAVLFPLIMMLLPLASKSLLYDTPHYDLPHSYHFYGITTN